METARRVVFLGALLGVFASSAGCGDEGGSAKPEKEPDESTSWPLGPDGTLVSSAGAEYLAHEVIVRPAQGASVEDLEAVIEGFGARVLDQDTPLARRLGYLKVSLPQNVIADEAISFLSQQGIAEKAERNYVVVLDAEPNDPSFAELWGMAKISAPAAWDLATGSRDIVVAVSDTGVDYTHGDLAANMWVNEGEIAGNGVDDDGNGYVDDARGWDFASGDNDPRDDHGHGTHCSGTIGGVGDNGIGVAGVNWRVRIMPVKFLTSSGSGSLWNGAQTIIYAAEAGAEVVSASWGCAGCYASYVEEAIETLHQAGGIFVAAAGNSSVDVDATPYYPAAYQNDNVVAVAASTPQDTLAYFSNYGAQKVHLAAPGTSILSTLPKDGYASWQGTSMAAPHVAGAAALYLSLKGETSPSALKNKLMLTTDPVPALDGVVASGGRLNVNTLLRSDDVAPDAPTDVRATAGTRSDVTVSWTASPGDDVVSYRVAWRSGPGEYMDSKLVPRDATSARIGELENGAAHFFAVRALDASGNWSPYSDEAVAVPNDASAPPQVIDLKASTASGLPVSGHVSSASGEASDEYAAAQAMDGTVATSWISPARSEPTEEFLHIAFDEGATIDRVVLVASPTHPQFFPVDFDIEVSEDGGDWRAVAGRRGVALGAAEELDLRFPATPAARLRLKVLRGFAHPSGFYYSGLAEIEIFQVSTRPDMVELRFTAPGDDTGGGRAQSYDIRYAKAPFDDSGFDSAVSAPAPAPSEAGIMELVQVEGLEGNTVYYFALKAVDEAGNVSAMSNVASTSTLVKPPAPIEDLSVQEKTSASVTLSWTATGASGHQGTAASYELRHSPFPISESTFLDAAAVAGVLAPAAAGTAETFTVTGLESEKRYYFAIRAVDAVGTPGGISNVVSARTTDGVDVIPPARIGDLFAFAFFEENLAAGVDVEVSSTINDYYKGENLIDGNSSTYWMSSYGEQLDPEWVVVDYGRVMPFSRFRFLPSSIGTYLSYAARDFDIELSAGGDTWQSVVHVEGRLATGDWQQWRTDPVSARYLRFHAKKRGIGGCYGDYGCVLKIPVVLSEIESYALTGELSADLMWVAPGDDGFEGTAARYDVRRSLQPLSEASFGGAEQLLSPAPGPAGTIEMVGAGPLEWEREYWFAVKAIDAAGNVGELSNLARVETPGMPPAPISDLTASNPTRTSIDLNWTSTGDDGYEGRASAYEIRYHTAPVDAQNWQAASVVVGVPEPAPSGQAERFVVDGLEHSTRYYFAVKVADDVGHESLLSNVATASTIDGVPPRAVEDLTAVGVDDSGSRPLFASALEASSAYSFAMDAENLVDGDPHTVWLTEGTADGGPEWVILGLDEVRSVTAIRLTPANGYLDLFPKAFTVEVRDSADADWRTVMEEGEMEISSAPEEWAIGTNDVLQVRLTATELGTWSGESFAALSEIELIGDAGGTSSIELSWTAPEDLGSESGKASDYDIRSATTTIVTESDFGAATGMPAPVPAPAGILERLVVPGLEPETTRCFVLKSEDAAGNRSGLSNSPCATVPGASPDAVADLQATDAAANSVALSWTAPDDNGSDGFLDRYEIRFATFRIHSESWADAAVVAEPPIPAHAGTTQSFVVEGLTGDTLYHFALVGFDAAGRGSAVSNNAVAKTLDGTPPGAVGDLAADAVAPSADKVASAKVTAGSSRYSLETSPDKAGDGDAGTFWLSEGTSEPTTQSLEIALDEPKAVGRVELLGAPGYLDLFPVDFSIEVRASASDSWRTAVKETGFATDGGAEEWLLGSLQVAQARLVVTGSASWNQKHYAALSEIVFYEDTTDRTAIRLSWTAPGDDADQGIVARYDMRAADALIETEQDYAGATKVALLDDPRTAGSLERAEVAGLEPETSYCFALTAWDDSDNRSPLSNSACATTAGVPPAAVVDLAAVSAGSGAVELTWTAPGADANVGTAAQYELRYAPERITSQSWDEAAVVEIHIAPKAAGSAESFLIEGLEGASEYFFVIRALDDAGNAGGLSNNASVTTDDDVDPSSINDLAAATNAAGWGLLSLSWTAPGDDGLEGTADHYELRWSDSSIDANNFGSANAAIAPAPLPAGSTHNFTLSDLPPEREIYVAMRAFDDAGNGSILSNVASARTRDEAPGRIADLRVSEAQAEEDGSVTVTLSWTAPGDDAGVGTAAAYDIRYSDGPLGDSSFGSAAQVQNTPAPGPAGTAHAVSIAGLAGGKIYRFAMKTVDERQNWSALSNVVQGTTPDEVAPAAVSDLFAVTGTSRGTVTLTWTSTGDDGTEGSAAGYELRYSDRAIDANNFEQATRAAYQPGGGPAGIDRSFTAQALPDETLLYFAMKAFDDSGNVSGLSNAVSARTPDVLPIKISNLAVTERRLTGLTVSFTAPGDDATSGVTEQYDLRVSTSGITTDTFAQATRVDTPIPQHAGTTESIAIDGLEGNTTYYVAIKAMDDRGNWSALSNVLVAATRDALAPGQIEDLAATTAGTDGAIDLTWHAPGDDGDVGRAEAYELRRALGPIDASNWSSATVVTGLPRPGSAGAAERWTVFALQGETRHYFAIKAIDADGNEGALSPPASAETRPVPPAPVGDLLARAASQAVVLEWTAPGDDGNEGIASRYEIRYSTVAIDKYNFHAATAIGNPPSPLRAGSAQSVTVTGLAESTRYWFALKATDDKGATSTISNIATVVTLDETGPAAVSALSVDCPPIGGGSLPLVAAEVSSELSESVGARSAIDGRFDTAWVSDAAEEATAESLLVDLGTSRSVDAVRLLPHEGYLELFPRTFTMEASLDRANWTPVHTVDWFEAAMTGWHTWGFAPVPARFIRLLTDDAPASYFGLHYTVLAELRVVEARALDGRAKLTWFAPGDDGNAGTAKYYEVFVHTGPFGEENLGEVELVSGAPIPQVAGTLQSMWVGELDGERDYYWALRAVDEVGNVGALSQVAVARTQDIPPARVGDLEAIDAGQTELTLVWTAPGDDGHRGTAAEYEIRFDTRQFTTEGFPLADLVSSAPSPMTAGSEQSVVVSELEPGQTYYFALVARDEVGATSALSNVARAQTVPLPDHTAPAAVSDLVAEVPMTGDEVQPATATWWSSEQAPDYAASNVTDGSLSTMWSSTAAESQTDESIELDLGRAVACERIAVHPAAGYEELFPRSVVLEVSPDGLTWATVHAASDIDASNGEPIETRFPVSLVRYVRFTAAELAEADNGYFYAVVSEIEVRSAEAQPGTVVASWTASGDDGSDGRAAVTDLRIGPCPFVFETSATVGTDPPRGAGQTETARAFDLPAGTYCLGVEIVDEAGNRSAISNIAQVTVEVGAPECGDGAVDPGETCDDGVNDGAYGGCLPDCSDWAGRCGDGTCDGAHEDLGSCAADCEFDLALIAPSSLLAAVSADVDQYVRDIEAEGRRARVVPWTGGTAGDLKGLIAAERDDYGIEGAWLLGELPAAWYEQTAFGTHEEFPIDLYLMDLDATWTDGDGDGIFDGHSDLELDVYVSRVVGDAQELSAYFGKLHEYRTLSALTDVSAYIFKDDDWSGYYSGHEWGLDAAYADVHLEQDRARTTRANYLAKLTGQGAEFVYQWIHSAPRYLYVTGSGGGAVTTTDIAAQNLRGSFYNLFDCSAARFTKENLAMTYLLKTDAGLATIGSTKTGGIYTPAVFHGRLAEGAEWGRAYRQWYNENGKYNDEWYLGIVILGDPLLGLRYGDAAGAGFVEDPPWTQEQVQAMEQTMMIFAQDVPLDGYAQYKAEHPEFF